MVTVEINDLMPSSKTVQFYKMIHVVVLHVSGKRIVR